MSFSNLHILDGATQVAFAYTTVRTWAIAGTAAAGKRDEWWLS